MSNSWSWFTGVLARRVDGLELGAVKRAGELAAAAPNGPFAVMGGRAAVKEGEEGRYELPRRFELLSGAGERPNFTFHQGRPAGFFSRPPTGSNRD